MSVSEHKLSCPVELGSALMIRCIPIPGTFCIPFENNDNHVFISPVGFDLYSFMFVSCC